MMYRSLVFLAIAATFVAVVGHYFAFGPKRVARDTGKRTVRRFQLWEVAIHAVTLLSFLTLAGTGMVAVLCLKSALHGWLWVIHIVAAPIFALGLYGMVALWARDCGFYLHDWEWAKKFGGYLWGDKHAPADRFNAGQKAYFWTIALLGLVAIVSGLGRVMPVLDQTGQDLLYQVHRYTALIFVAAGLVHLYLGTLANPGTFGAMLYGKVSEPWAEDHHPLWWATLRGRKKNSQKNEKSHGKK